MIIADKLGLSFGSQTIFDEVSFTFNPEQKVGLVGRNGSGKSTLLKIISKQHQYDGGSISIGKNLSLAYLPQEVTLRSHLSILDEAFSVFTQIHRTYDDKIKLELAMQNNPEDQIAIEQYASVCQKLTELSPDTAKAEAKKILSGLGFLESQFDNPVANLSVGWKMRVVLAKLLLQNADFYLFDEPTNHLDIVAKDWFIEFLKKAPFGFVMVCHEKYLMNQLCSSIFELERGKGIMYSGNYSKYEQLKSESLEQLQHAYKNQQSQIKQKEKTIERFRYKATKAKMAQSMIKALDKVERLELPPGARDISFSFGSLTQPGKYVITLSDVKHSFNTKLLFSNINCLISRGQKVALIAANGMGKTTLFNLISKKLTLQSGTISLGHNVATALFDQDQTAVLELEKTVFQNIQLACPKSSDQVIRSMLGAFLFSNKEVEKKVGVLSGGEKNRVGMVKTLLAGANVLLLDEPTNHLDIPTKEILLRALQSYEGSIIFVSHDHDFVNLLATHILELTPQGLVSYEGNYESYLEHKKNMLQQNTAASTNKSTQDKNKSKSTDSKDELALAKQVKSLEKKVERLEYEINNLQMKFADLEYGTPDFAKTQQSLAEIQEELAHTYKLWEASASQLL